jgi:hypothetical protein
MGKCNKNLFTDTKTQKIIDNYGQRFENYIKMQKETFYNRFLFDMQQSNTI